VNELCVRLRTFAVNDMSNLYSFSSISIVVVTGFPPPLWLELSEMWNKSHSEYLICYHGPRAIIADYEFDVELLAQTQTSMHGSKEGHMGYLYKRKTPVVSTGEECDALFADSWNLVKSGFEPLRQAVTAEMDENMGVGPRTRSSRRQLLTRS
jgi:hypothetical protein